MKSRKGRTLSLQLSRGGCDPGGAQFEKDEEPRLPFAAEGEVDDQRWSMIALRTPRAGSRAPLRQGSHSFFEASCSGGKTQNIQTPKLTFEQTRRGVQRHPPPPTDLASSPGFGPSWRLFCTWQKPRVIVVSESYCSLNAAGSCLSPPQRDVDAKIAPVRLPEVPALVQEVLQKPVRAVVVVQLRIAAAALEGPAIPVSNPAVSCTFLQRACVDTATPQKLRQNTNGLPSQPAIPQLASTLSATLKVGMFFNWLSRRRLHRAEHATVMDWASQNIG